MIYFKRIITILLFIIGLAAILVFVSFIFVPKDNASGSGMEETSANGILAEKSNSIDVLVLGDSESYSSVSPMQIWQKTGYASYVCGASGQKLSYTQTLLKRAFEKQSPKIVILETLAIYRVIPLDTSVTDKVSDYFTVFRYHDRWKSLKARDFKSNIKYTWTDDYKGYIYNANVESSKNTDYMKHSEAIANIHSINYDYVKEIKKMCDEKGASLLLLSTPSTINWNYGRHNGIQNLADELGCKYIDLNLINDELKIDWNTDTRDKGDHMNYRGAVKVTDYLIQYLMSTKKLCDHRDDERYDSWNKSLKKYKILVGDSKKS